MLRRKKVCLTCESVIYPRSITKGSLGMEILLWFFLVIPGIAYSVWRLTTRYDGCPKCKSPNLVGLSSPAGRRIIDAIGKNGK